MSDIRPAEARDILQDLAESGPIHGVHRWGDTDYECFHCKAIEDRPHKEDCRWKRARVLLGMEP